MIHRLRRPIAAALVFALAGAIAPLRAQDAALKIVVLEGEDGVNIIEKKTAVKPVVEVRDKNDLPVAGAIVIFTIIVASAGGGEALFGNGLKMLTVTTDASGRATAGELQALSRGNVEMKVQAFNKGQVASTTIRQRNYVTEAEAADAAKGKAEPDEKSQQNSGQNQSGQDSQNANGSPPAPAAGTVAATAPGASAPAAPTATGSSTAASTAAASGGTAARGGGVPVLAIVGLAAGAASGALGIYSAVQESSGKEDCLAQWNQFGDALDTYSGMCEFVFNPPAQCNTAAQRALNTYGQFCSCVGTPPSGLTFLAIDNTLRSPRDAIGVPISCR